MEDRKLLIVLCVGVTLMCIGSSVQSLRQAFKQPPATKTVLVKEQFCEHCGGRVEVEVFLKKGVKQ